MKYKDLVRTILLLDKKKYLSMTVGDLVKMLKEDREEVLSEGGFMDTYGFPFEDATTLVKYGEKTIFIKDELLTLDQVNELIHEQGYTPLPF